MRKPILILSICLVLITGARSQTPKTSHPEALKAALQLKLEEWHKTGTFPGATLGVALANGESFGLAVGVSDRETKTPMKANDRMLAGSTGKTFAAATALQDQTRR
jgi:CubicO group peptidase (beta-lactamase class C family)